MTHGLLDRVRCPRPVGDVQARVQVHESLRESLNDLGTAHAGDAGTHARIDGYQVDLVARAVSQRRQKQGGLDRGIQARRAPQRDRVDLLVLGRSEKCGGRATAVHDDHNVTVAFGAPLTHHQLG